MRLILVSSKIKQYFTIVILGALTACGTQQDDGQTSKADMAFHRFHAPLDSLLERSEKLGWEEANRTLHLVLDEKKRLLVELHYRAAELTHIAERMRDQNIVIKRINHNYERMTVWVSTSAALWSLAQMDGIYLVAEASEPLHHSVMSHAVY